MSDNESAVSEPEQVEAAHAEIARLCSGGRWIMSIPARPGYDSDLLISDALNLLEARLSKVEELVGEWEAHRSDLTSQEAASIRLRAALSAWWCLLEQRRTHEPAHRGRVERGRERRPASG